MTGERLELPSRDGPLDTYLFHPRDTGHSPAVVFYMDAFGVRPELGSMAQRIADAGFLVALPNLYYRSGAFEPFDKTRVFAEGPERDRFKGMIASITNDMVMADTALLMRALEQHPRVSERAPWGAVGYCMGGGFALSAAGTFPEKIAVAASFHGGSLATDKPGSPHLLASRMRATVYVGVAEIDPSFTADQQQRLRAALESAHVPFTIETYAGAKHGFAVNGHPVYDHESSERHWQRLLPLLTGALTPARQ